MGIKRWDGTQWVSTNTPMTANNITNDSNVSGSKVKDALNTLNTDATTSVHGLMSATDKTKLNGIEANANNYTLPVAGSALGGVKSGTDITVDSNGNVSVNDDSHNHIISNVDGLLAALDAKITNPSGGTAGQVLKKTASGEAWENESPGGVWGQIEGTLSDQDDLNAELTSHTSQITALQTADTNIFGSEAWNSTTSYTVGSMCIYNNTLWKCETANSGITPVEGTHWTKVSLKSLGALFTIKDWSFGDRSMAISDYLLKCPVLMLSQLATTINIDAINASDGYILKIFSPYTTGTLPTNIIGGNTFIIIGLSSINSSNNLPIFGVQLAIGFGSAKIAIRNAPFNSSGSAWNAWIAIT